MSKVKNKYELFTNIFANEEQKIAIDRCLDFLKDKSKDSIFFTLSGKGGTGKTTIIKKVVEEGAKNSYIMAAAPSHAAKNVLKDSLGTFVDEVHTVASILGMKLNVNKGKFEIDEYARREFGIPIETADILIIDECSMLGEEVVTLIKKHKSSHCKVIFLGDYHQLPPIRKEDDTLFKDTNSPTFDSENKAELKTRMRQEKDSPIIPITDVYADAIESIDKREQFFDIPLRHDNRVTNFDRESDEGVIFTNNKAQAIHNLGLDFIKAKETNDLNYVRGLVYTNNIRREINQKVRSILFKDQLLEQFMIGENVISFSTYSIPGGKVVTHNSSIYKVIKIKEGRHRSGYKLLKLTLETVNKRNITVPVIAEESLADFNAACEDFINNKLYRKYYELLESVANIQYAYAITCHKSQGSTYRNAYVFEDSIMEVVSTSSKTKFQSLYVATSRPKKKLVIISKHN